MSDDIQKINTISGGQNAQNVYGNQVKTNIYIENQNNHISQNLKIDLIYNQEGVLLNTKELFISLLNANTNHHFCFKIIGLDNFLSLETIQNYSFDLKIIYLKSNELDKNWNDKNIREFIYKVKDIKSLNNLLAKIEEEKLNKFIYILTDFLKDEKIKKNKIPDISDLRLALRFYRKNVDFDFIEVIGYEFDSKLNINDLINILEKKYNKSIDILKEVRNLNKDTLEFFLNVNDSNNWTIQKLYECDILKSNLNQVQAKTINDLFDFALKGYFKDEDINEWLKLKNYYLEFFDKQIIHSRINSSNMSSRELINKLNSISDEVTYNLVNMEKTLKELKTY
ncbi:hypothetical protein [Aliarcobacter butzleri]|uniref:hypothetical protein n=1 Tax=Aliarcobacter butzleri TaxID=28197 RepID=UPI002B243E22|nr:hypothetical protein [Aliarcobacter butzleri]